MNHKQSTCEIFEPLISGMIDGELTRQEHEKLRGHLDACSQCAEQLKAFEMADRVIRVQPRVRSDLSAVSLSGLNSLAKSKSAKPATNQPTIWTPLRLIPLASAAVLLLALGIMVANDSKTATADQVTPAQIVEPMKDLFMINQQLHQDQQLMLRTLGMDLRLLKVEIGQLEPGSSERQRLSERLDAMVEKVRTFEAQQHQQFEPF